MSTRSAFYPVPREILSFGYIRLSDDNDGTMTSPETQWTAIRRAANRFGIPIPPPERVYTDRNLSASNTDVIRLAYRRMLKAIGAVDSRKYEVVVLAYGTDRVYCQPQDWQHFSELLGADNLDGRLITDYENEIDLGSMGVFAVGAAYVERKKTAKRTRDNIHTHAEKGKGHGQVGYGWTRNYDHSGVGKPISKTVIVPEQAAVIRDIAERLLKGESLRSICADLNAREIPTPGGRKVIKRNEAREPIAWAKDFWLPQTVRHLMMRKALKGIRVHTNGKGARQVTTEYKGDWEAILDDDTFDNLYAKLTDPERRTTISSTAKHLLSGTATCGVCAAAVRGQTTKAGNSQPYHVYRDDKSHVVRSEARTDEVVVTEVLHILSQPEIRRTLTPRPDSDAREALASEAGLIARKDAAADDYAEGRIDRATMIRITENIGRQLEQLQAKIRRVQDTAIYAELINVDAADIEALWESYPIDRQRSIVRALFTVVIMPTSARGKSAFDPSLIVVTLRPMREGNDF